VDPWGSESALQENKAKGTQPGFRVAKPIRVLIRSVLFSVLAPALPLPRKPAWPTPVHERIALLVVERKPTTVSPSLLFQHRLRRVPAKVLRRWNRGAMGSGMGGRYYKTFQKPLARPDGLIFNKTLSRQS